MPGRSTIAPPHQNSEEEPWPLERHGAWLESQPAEHFQPLLALLPELPAAQEPVNGERPDPAALPYPNSRELHRFITLCYDLRIMIVFDWPAWRSEVPFDQRPELIDTFDRTTCCMALTALVRGDRFNEGLVAWAWASGLLGRIVGQLKVLLEDIGLI